MNAACSQPHNWDYRRRSGERWLFDAQGRLVKRITVRGEIHSLTWSANTAVVKSRGQTR